MPKLPPLIDAETLHAHLDDPDLRILDASIAFLPDEPNEREVYDREHLPGAAFADLRGALSDPDSAHSFTVPSAERFAAAAGALGIGPGTHVVVYAQNWPIWATRMWWLLRFFGFDDVSVLDVFKSLDEQRAALEEIGALDTDQPVIAYCGGGVSATLDLFSLSLLGVADAKLYDGSLSEWLSDPSRPVEVG